jgi:hypothetical protein
MRLQFVVKQEPLQRKKGFNERKIATAGKGTTEQPEDYAVSKVHLL